MGRGRARGSGFLVAPSFRVNAPRPVNLPSLKKENKGLDITVSLVHGSGGWFHGGHADPEQVADVPERGRDLSQRDYPSLNDEPGDDPSSGTGTGMAQHQQQRALSSPLHQPACSENRTAIYMFFFCVKVT
jgi:hypothetical protein